MSDVKIVYNDSSKPQIYINGTRISGVYNFGIGQKLDAPQTFHLDLYANGVEIEYPRERKETI